MKKFVLALALVIFADRVWAAETHPGVGTKSCGEYVKSLEEDRKQGEWTNLTMVFISWCQGFLTARVGPDFILIPHAYAVEKWLENYCKEHPLDPFTMACRDLAEELRKRARAK